MMADFNTSLKSVDLEDKTDKTKYNQRVNASISTLVKGFKTDALVSGRRVDKDMIKSHGPDYNSMINGGYQGSEAGQIINNFLQMFLEETGAKQNETEELFNKDSDRKEEKVLSQSKLIERYGDGVLRKHLENHSEELARMLNIWKKHNIFFSDRKTAREDNTEEATKPMDEFKSSSLGQQIMQEYKAGLG